MPTRMLIDTHCHIDDKRFDDDRDAMLSRARQAGVARMITIGCHLSNSQEALNLSLAHPDIYFSAGIHPHESAEAPADFEVTLRTLGEHPRCVAIGECGLDYFYDHSPRETQRLVLIKQIQIAIDLKKPLVIHLRDAFDDCLSIFKSHDYSKIPVVIHCFSGTWEEAQVWLDLGFFLSLSGIVTFKNPGDLLQVAEKAPLNRLLVETDAPYLTPIPHRGQRNEPAYVKLVAEKIALARGITLEEVIEQTGKNAMGIFWA